MRVRAVLVALPVVAGCIVLSRACVAQTPGQNGAQAQPANPNAAPSGAIMLPNAPENTKTLGGVQPTVSATAIKSKNAPVMINGRPYVRPTPKEQFDDYAKNTYGWPALAFTSIRVSIAQARGKPEEWGQDWPGFGQRFGSASATTAIDGNVRYGMEMLFKEDMRYIPCHGCSIHRKIENALLAEVTARHDTDGHRFFTLTPTLSRHVRPDDREQCLDSRSHHDRWLHRFTVDLRLPHRRTLVHGVCARAPPPRSQASGLTIHSATTVGARPRRIFVFVPRE